MSAWKVAIALLMAVLCGGLTYWLLPSGVEGLAQKTRQYPAEALVMREGEVVRLPVFVLVRAVKDNGRHWRAMAWHREMVPEGDCLDEDAFFETTFPMGLLPGDDGEGAVIVGRNAFQSRKRGSGKVD